MRKGSHLFVALLLALSIGAGCSSQTKTVRTETTQYPTETLQNPTEPAAVNRQTTTTTETRRESGGLVSGTVHAVGQVIALPFRIVGGVIETIF